MQTIYSNCLESIGLKGNTFHINFKQKSLKVNGRYVIRNGQFNGELGVEKCSDATDFIAEVEDRYVRYKHSTPSKLSDAPYRKSYFKALSESELSDDDMLYGHPRALAKFELEMYILCQWLLGFEWESISSDKWFWQSESDKDLVLIKDWF